MINRHYKFSISLSILFSILIFFLFFRFGFFSGIEQLLMLVVIPGLVTGLFIKETTLVRYSKSALRESLIFGLVFFIIIGSLFSTLERENGPTVFNVWGFISFVAGLFLFGFALSFFGSLIAVIPKYFVSLGTSRQHENKSHLY